MTVLTIASARRSASIGAMSLLIGSATAVAANTCPPQGGR